LYGSGGGSEIHGKYRGRWRRWVVVCAVTAQGEDGGDHGIHGKHKIELPSRIATTPQCAGHAENIQRSWGIFLAALGANGESRRRLVSVKSDAMLI